MCVCSQRKRSYLLEQGLCMCVGDCACCLHSLPLKVQSICLGTWKKKSSQCHNRSDTHKKSFQPSYSAPWPFLFQNFWWWYILRDIVLIALPQSKLHKRPFRTWTVNWYSFTHLWKRKRKLCWKDQVKRSEQIHESYNMQARHLQRANGSLGNLPVFSSPLSIAHLLVSDGLLILESTTDRGRPDFQFLKDQSFSDYWK